MNIKVKNNSELMEMARDAIHILNNLRHHTKYWDEHYGALAKNAKRKWEERADEFLEKIQATKTNNRSQVKISNENPLQVSLSLEN